MILGKFLWCLGNGPLRRISRGCHCRRVRLARKWRRPTNRVGFGGGIGVFVEGLVLVLGFHGVERPKRKTKKEI